MRTQTAICFWCEFLIESAVTVLPTGRPLKSIFNTTKIEPWSSRATEGSSLPRSLGPRRVEPRGGWLPPRGGPRRHNARARPHGSPLYDTYAAIKCTALGGSSTGSPRRRVRRCADGDAAATRLSDTGAFSYLADTPAVTHTPVRRHRRRRRRRAAAARPCNAVRTHQCRIGGARWLVQRDSLSRTRAHAFPPSVAPRSGSPSAPLVARRESGGPRLPRLLSVRRRSHAVIPIGSLWSRLPLSRLPSFPGERRRGVHVSRARARGAQVSRAARRFYDNTLGVVHVACRADAVSRVAPIHHQAAGASCRTTSDAEVQMIQEQMDALADTKSVGEERYARAKQENAMLEARILILEESAKDAETRAGEKLHDEQRRFREAKERVERECNLQLENYNTKLKSAETESTGLREEIVRIRDQLNKISEDKTRLENDLREARREADAARESERYAISRTNEAHHMLDAMREELSLRSEDQQRLEELVQQVAQLQARNKSLEESRDELQAAVALQAGRELLMLNPCNNNAEKGPSLAVELLAGMNPDQIDGQEEFSEPCTMAELKQALKEQQEVNTQLRTYIDGILLNIVENYPQLLEVKQTH
ncbi:PREDICTED: uncharacterized protein LOC105560750 isoform X1 [Vollenhovia emeryi]|uniref:uncharacterized protein LOC105560750 isoform X1 n=1 Tax=Vollenhovia emeryi TaxID=411798 RepID=UPI0005F574BE|nr:PREDICTED: uncharacterized protein LOC105560750 isoform X1 [Vollenhovia emeryi]